MGFDIMNKYYLKAQYGATGIPIFVFLIEELEKPQQQTFMPVAIGSL